MYNKYSKASDVYAFAFLLYRFLFLKDPYEDCENQHKIYKVVIKKERPGLKKICKIYKINEAFCLLIKSCWSDNPKERPTFDKIVEELANDPKLFANDVDAALFKKYVSSFQDKINTWYNYLKLNYHLNKIEQCIFFLIFIVIVC